MTANLQDRLAICWGDIPIFLAVYRHKSFGAAATRLAMDTSTVSRHISRLEDALGLRLFERTRQGLLCTRAAERVLGAAEAMEAAFGQFGRDATDIEQIAEGTVRLSVAPGMANVFVAPLLGRLRDAHPRINIEIDASAQLRDLTRQEADLALRSVRPSGADLVLTKVGEGPWLPAASPALARRLARVSSWSDCPWITWDRDMTSFGPAQWVARHASKADIVLRTSHFASQLVAAETSLGVALVPAPYIEACDLEPVEHDRALDASIEALPRDSLYLVGHRVLRDVPRVAAVWSFLARELRVLMKG
jgi:DNA-binding transcriptional LysR family regulator